MPEPKRKPMAPKPSEPPSEPLPRRDPRVIARKAVARMGPRLDPGPKLRLPLTLDLMPDDAEQLMAEAIAAERQLDGVVTELVVAHRHRPSTGQPAGGGEPRRAAGAGRGAARTAR